MITAATVKRPLPVRPIDGLVTGSPVRTTPTAARGVKHPLPVKQYAAVRVDLADALRDAAHRRLMAAASVKHPLPVVRPS